MSNPFPSHSLDNRLTQIDLTSQELSKQLDGYTQLQELVENIPNLLKVEQSLKTFQKKTKELEAKLKDNKSLITQAKKNLKDYTPKAKRTLTSTLTQQDRDQRILNNNLSKVEGTFRQVTLENQMGIKTIEVGVKEEVCNVMQGIEEKLQYSRKSLTQKMVKAEHDFKEFSRGLAEGTKEITLQLEEFEEAYAPKMQRLNELGLIQDVEAEQKEQTMHLLLEQVRQRLQNQIAQLDQEFTDRYIHLNVRYNTDLLALKSEIESARDVVLEESLNAPNEGGRVDAQLARKNDNARKIIAYLCGFSIQSLDNVKDILNALAQRQAAGEEGLQEALHECSVKVEQAETRINFNLQKTEQILKQSKDVASGVGRLATATIGPELEKTHKMMKELAGIRELIETKIMSCRGILERLRGKILPDQVNVFRIKLHAS